MQFKNNDLHYATKDKVAKATVNLYGRITSLTRRPVNWFEDTIGMRSSRGNAAAGHGRLPDVYSKSIPLAPGTYRLNIVAKDMVGNTMNNFEMALVVPHYEEDQLRLEQLILADQLERVATNSIGGGPVRDPQFEGPSSRRATPSSRDETMGIYTEFYNLGMDEKTKKPTGTHRIYVMNKANNQTVMSQTEDLSASRTLRPSLLR